MTTRSPVEPALFDLLDQYSDAIKAGKVRARRSVRRSSRVVTFLQSFFEQLFASCFDIQLEAFDDESKRLSVELRHEKNVEELLRPVVSAFEEACDLYPDIIGSSYGGGSATTFRRFHKRYLPRLLQSVQRWAHAVGHAELAERAHQSNRRLGEALGAAGW